jgi:L-aspartate oxidase
VTPDEAGAAARPRDAGPGPLDVLVVGSGVAGLSAAVRAAAIPRMRVGVLTKAELSQAATRWAQGGVAAVLGGDEDSTDSHLADTLAAGAGLCDADAVRILVDEGPGRVNDLIALGAVFDRRPSGDLARSREGGHSFARVVHAGGAATGAEIERALVEAVRASAAALLERWFAVDLLVRDGACEGVVALDPSGASREVRARHVLLASGGSGQIFAVTTNPPESTGDGIAMAMRAGAAVADVEFMQFHPTALHHPAMPRPLLSEALRGHGALIRDATGERFIDELSPRDAVSRAMAARMIEQGVDHLWLDATCLDGFDQRFPTIGSSVRAIGLDPGRDWLPIAPAAHYMSGGLLVDLDGATSVARLWAAGEAACSGVHGANRLASNSLLEGMVFAARVVEAIEAGREGACATGAMRALFDAGSAEEGAVGGRVLHASVPDREPGPGRGSVPSRGSAPDGIAKLQQAMSAGAGVLRSAESLSLTREVVSSLEPPSPSSRAEWELANLVQVSGALLRAAEERKESRGAHNRSDYPEQEPSYRVRLVQLARERVGR